MGCGIMAVGKKKSCTTVRISRDFGGCGDARPPASALKRRKKLDQQTFVTIRKNGKTAGQTISPQRASHKMFELSTYGRSVFEQKNISWKIVAFIVLISSLDNCIYVTFRSISIVYSAEKVIGNKKTTSPPFDFFHAQMQHTISCFVLFQVNLYLLSHSSPWNCSDLLQLRFFFPLDIFLRCAKSSQ